MRTKSPVMRRWTPSTKSQVPRTKPSAIAILAASGGGWRIAPSLPRRCRKCKRPRRARAARPGAARALAGAAQPVADAGGENPRAHARAGLYVIDRIAEARESFGQQLGGVRLAVGALPVQLDEDRGADRTQQPFRALDDLMLGALDVDLHEVGRRQRVQGRGLVERRGLQRGGGAIAAVGAGRGRDRGGEI